MRLNRDWSRHGWAEEDDWAGQGSSGRMRSGLRSSRPGGGSGAGGGAHTASLVAEVTQDFDRAVRRDQMRSGCPPRLRNLLIGCANIVVLVFILVVINKIFSEHEVDTGEVCYAEDMK